MAWCLVEHGDKFIFYLTLIFLSMHETKN